MTLSKEQIQFLFRFCEKHVVYYYDVQLELVDHLANAIESRMAADKNLSFEQALDRVYADFGIMGFAPIVREKLSQGTKIVKRKFIQMLFRQFGWPRILLFLFAVSFLYTVLSWSTLVGVILIAAMVVSSEGILLMREIKVSRMVKRSGKKFIIMGYQGAFAGSGMYFTMYLLAQMLSHFDSLSDSILFLSILSSIILVLSIAAFQTNKAISNQLISDFPEVFQLSE